MKSTQILTAAESGNFAPPGPVRIWSYFGPLAGPISGRISSRLRFEDSFRFVASGRLDRVTCLTEASVRSKDVSRGRFRILTLRCPEVGLEFQL